MSKTSQVIKENETVIQLGLNKRYADELYLYLEECQLIDLKENWSRINSHNCMDLSNLNNSYLGASTILDESMLDMQPSCSKNKRK